jgi:hypothetical protein
VFQFGGYPGAMTGSVDRTVQTLADRAEIDDLLTRYTHAVDTRQFDRLDKVFTQGAHIDYTATGGIAGSFREVQAWLREALTVATHMQHLLGQREVVFGPAGGGRPAEATVRAYFWNPMRIAPPEGDALELHLGGIYEHDLVRTDVGWRSRRLVEHLLWRR